MTSLLTRELTYNDGMLVSAFRQLNLVLQRLTRLYRVPSLHPRNLLQSLPEVRVLAIGECPKRIIELTVLTSQQMNTCAGYSTWSIKR